MESFYHRKFIKKRIANPNKNNFFVKKLKAKNILQKADAWPATNSLFIYEDVIVFVGSKNKLTDALK